MKEKPKKTISLSFRIDEELNKRIEEKADKYKRTKSNFVINIITEALEDIERKENLYK